MSDLTARQLSLVLVLINTKRPLTRAEIFTKVPTYGGDPTNLAQVRKFERDKSDLRDKLGIPIATGTAGAEDDIEGYWIDPDSVMIPNVTLTPEDLRIIWLASTVWGNAELADPAHEADFLLARGLDDEHGGPVAGLSGIVGALVEAVSTGRLVEFDYSSKRSQSTGRRRVEPWRVFLTGGAWYMVGFDVDAMGPDQQLGGRRIFRLSRFLGDVTVTEVGARSSAPKDLDVRELVRGWLDLPGTHQSAVLRVAVDTCGHLRSVASHITPGDTHDRLTIDFEFEDRLARAIAAVCDRVIVESPSSLRVAVSALVDGAVAHE